MSNILVISLVLFNYFPRNTGSVQQFSAPKAGTYKLECWGASGGDDNGGGAIGYGGRGGFTKGSLNLNSGITIYMCIGSVGTLGENIYFNGGGKSHGACSGGGATDIRLVYTNWNDFESLKSRIMVAGGGGGGENEGCNGGAAGGLLGYNNKSGIISGATQTTGFGFGVALYQIYNNDGWGGGGNGYYSGYSATAQTGNYHIDSGGGGSSFISGYLGCDAISENSTLDKISHTGSPNHYSGYIFTNPQMIDGVSSMPSPSGGTEIGHLGNGYCIISYIP